MYFLCIGGEFDGTQLYLDEQKPEEDPRINNYRKVLLTLGEHQQIVFVDRRLSDAQAGDLIRRQYHDTPHKP